MRYWWCKLPAISPEQRGISQRLHGLWQIRVENIFVFGRIQFVLMAVRAHTQRIFIEDTHSTYLSTAFPPRTFLLNPLAIRVIRYTCKRDVPAPAAGKWIPNRSTDKTRMVSSYIIGLQFTAVMEKKFASACRWFIYISALMIYIKYAA